MEWLVLLLLFAFSWFWWDSTGTREIAIRHGKLLCQQADVVFLDETVVLQQLRLRRQRTGGMVFFRRFGFEFCTDGEHRYSGYIDMLGRVVQHSYMETYRLAENRLN